jgi:hypothetical protein
MYTNLRVKCPLFLSDVSETLIFPTDFRKKTQISNFIKIRPVGAEWFHADGHEATCRLLQFLAKAASSET